MFSADAIQNRVKRQALVLARQPIRSIVKPLLSSAGFMVTEPEDGQYALSIATKGRCLDPMCRCSPTPARSLLIAASPKDFDLLVSEAQPPGIDGWTLTSSFLREHPLGRVVLVSAEAEVDSINSESPGGWRFILRPRLAGMLLETIQAAGFLQPRRVILLAEDEPVIRNLVQTVLGKAGYSIIAAVDGEDAMQLSRVYSGQIDLVLSDIQMPRMDGIRLAEHIREQRPGTPVLLMTGFCQEVLPPGMELLTKPFDLRRLVATIRELLKP